MKKRIMKNLFLVIAACGISFAACNNTDNKTNGAKSDTAQTTQTTVATAPGTASIKGIVSGYLQLKNALSNDNGKDAAIGGKALSDALQKLDTAALTADQKKAYADLQDDMKEHAEHIGMNADKIAHQREHFEMLSKDMYDLVKIFPSGQTLYKDFCPMYNGGKGANWISETKEIKNPYLGKKMPTCGEMKEEIK